MTYLWLKIDSADNLVKKMFQIFSTHKSSFIKFLIDLLRTLEQSPKMSFFHWPWDNKALLDYSPTSIALKDIQSIVQEIFALDPVQDMNGGLEFFIDKTVKLALRKINE